ncbi:MAG TPA: hypothetical protein VGI90_12190 [Steroidobacteraceae bacterium]|jgi:hypothetical protein
MGGSGAQAETPAVAGTKPTALRFALLTAPLIGATFISKFGFPPLAALGIGVSIFFLLGAIAAGSVLGGMSIEPRRLALFTAMLGILGVIQIFQPNSFSPSSLLLLAAVHLPYIFTVPGGDDKQRIIKFFLGIVLLFAWCGIAQYCLQFFISPRFLFPIENFTPTGFIVQQFNHQAAMGYGSHEYRANGVFLLEPSFFSQVLAVAIIAELCTLGRMRRLAVYGLALLVSYSGTGLIVLAVCLPLCLIAQRRWGLLVCGLLVLAVIVPVQLHFHANRLLSRIGEFDSDQSSAYMRFVGGFRLFDRFLWQDFWRTLFGYGAGSFVSFSSRVHYYAAAEMALFKIVFEFGLVGAAAYFGFLFSCLYYSSAPRLLILAVAITYFLNGIYIPFAHGLALSLLLWSGAAGTGMWSKVPDRKRSHENLASTALPLPRGI